MKNRRKRLNFSVKRQMQIRLFIKVLGIIIVGVGLMAAVFYIYSDREINQSYRQFHIHAENFLDLLLPAVVISLIFALVASIVITLFLPIKIAGPVYRIERDLIEKVAHGDLTVKFKLRKGDELTDLADTLNKCLENLSRRIETIKRSANDLNALVADSKGVDNKDIKDIVAKINKELEHLKV